VLVYHFYGGSAVKGDGLGEDGSAYVAGRYWAVDGGKV
jgi:hypothetical protein